MEPVAQKSAAEYQPHLPSLTGPRQLCQRKEPSVIHVNDNPVVYHPDMFDDVIRVGRDLDTGRDMYVRGAHIGGSLIVLELLESHEDILRQPAPQVGGAR